MNRTPLFWSLLLGAMACIGILCIGLFFMTQSGPQPDKPLPTSPPTVAAASDNDLQHLLIGARSLAESLHPAQALPLLQKAVELYPRDLDARLDLANDDLLLDQPELALADAQEALKLDPGSAAAYFIAGSADLRLGRFEPAVKMLSQARHINPAVAAVCFQLGRAYQGMNKLEAARDVLQDAIRLDPRHPSAHYVLAMVLQRLGNSQEASRQLELHQEILGRQPDVQVTAATYERSTYTHMIVPLQPPEQPAPQGVKVSFTDITEAAFQSARYRGPAAIINPGHTGKCELFVTEAGGFRLLANRNGAFEPAAPLLPAAPGKNANGMLVGDLNNDGIDDIVVLGDKGTHVFTFAATGIATDITHSCGLANVIAKAAALADLDFTGKLGLWASGPDGNGMRFFRNQGNLTFKDFSAAAGAPRELPDVRQLIVADWNGDDLPDMIVGRQNQRPLLLRNQRTGPVTPDGSPRDWPIGSAIAVGDLNNDLRPQLVVARPGVIEITSGTGYQPVDADFGAPSRPASPAVGPVAAKIIPTGDFVAEHLYLVDYDNDGWLDVIAAGDGLRVWRNLGRNGFRDVTSELGLDKIHGHVNSVLAADFNDDGATDLLLDINDHELRLLRNDGGNAKRQIKLRLVGKRSNASGLGSRITLSAAGWRTSRTYERFPLEIGTGQHTKIDALTVHWYDLAVTLPPDLTFDPKHIVTITEIQLPTGSCPYLYAWDGKQFRFVTDILGAAPLGLPAAAGHLIDADTEELVWIGNEFNFAPREGNYVLQITDELRELLFLDQAALVAVDHPNNTEIHPTCKLRPGKPFPPPSLMMLGDRVQLKRATQLDGANVTAQLAEMDGKVVSPKLRIPQLRGLAEPSGVVLDFGPLPTDRTLVLALTGWLHFGGGMANIAGSEDPDLPFPFPVLQARTPDGWKPVDVVVGAPAGKTKTILVDLTGKLPPGTRQLKITTGFEIYWDRIALFQRAQRVTDAAPEPIAGSGAQRATATRMTTLAPASTDLHWRGFARYADQPWYVPLTPIYNEVEQTAPWSAVPTGWCTRYGPVDELLAHRDDHVVILNGGDELTLNFAADRLPRKPNGFVRDFFLLTSGWDKDADYHVVRGATVEPLPAHQMNDQLYGQSNAPTGDHDQWIQRYNTRWVGPRMLPRESESENANVPLGHD